MPIDEKLLEELLGAEKVQPDECLPKVWKDGEQVLRLAGARSWMIEGYVRAAAKKAHVPIDWHFAGGRAVILALPEDKEKACQALRDLLPTFQEAARQAVARGDEDVYEVQILHWGGVRPPKPEDFPPGAIAWDPVFNAFMFEDKGTHGSVKELKAGGELDALVATKVMGWPVYGHVGEGSQKVYNTWLARFKKREKNVLYLDNAGRLSRYSEELTQADENEEPQCEDWSPSTDIRAAMEVVAKIGTGLALHWVPNEETLRALQAVEGVRQGTGPWMAGMSELPTVRAETAPLAICRMALISVEHETAKK